MQDAPVHRFFGRGRTYAGGFSTSFIDKTILAIGAAGDMGHHAFRHLAGTSSRRVCYRDQPERSPGSDRSLPILELMLALRRRPARLKSWTQPVICRSGYRGQFLTGPRRL